MSPPFLNPHPTTLTGWVQALDNADIPVLHATANVMDELRLAEDEVDAHMLAPTLTDDPLATLKLLRHAARLRPVGYNTCPQTPTEALVMIGIPPFFRAFAQSPSVAEQRLGGYTDALTGFQTALKRTHQASRFAVGFAIHRQDPAAATIQLAALLNDFVELLLWVNAPAVALQLQQGPHDGASALSAKKEHALLGTTLADIRQALIRSWQLPDYFAQFTCDSPDPLPKTRNLQLAVRIARRDNSEWTDLALNTELQDLCELLKLTPNAAIDLLNELKY